MLYHLLFPLHESYSFFNVFRYITFRTIYAAITALLISFLLGPWMIRVLRSHQIGQTIRLDGPESHLSKEGTPTMGGLLILTASLVCGAAFLAVFATGLHFIMLDVAKHAGALNVVQRAVMLKPKRTE